MSPNNYAHVEKHAHVRTRRCGSLWPQVASSAGMRNVQDVYKLPEDEESASEDSVLERADVALIREIDPADADLYIDAIFSPLYRCFKASRGLQVRDYVVVAFFLLVNVGLQYALSYKVWEIATDGDSHGTYVDRQKVFGLCRKMDADSPSLRLQLNFKLFGSPSSVGASKFNPFSFPPFGYWRIQVPCSVCSGPLS